MKVKIISPVVNFPKFLDIQIEKFKENINEHFLDILFKTKYPENFDVIIDN